MNATSTEEKNEVIDQRERDIQAVCKHIVDSGIHSTGDYGSGGCCPYCWKDCRWDAKGLDKIQHELDCVYLIAKDLITRL